MCGYLSFSTVSTIGPNIEIIVVVVAFAYSGQHYHPNIQTFMHFTLYAVLFMGISEHKSSHKYHSNQHHDDNDTDKCKYTRVCMCIICILSNKKIHTHTSISYMSAAPK